MKVVIIAASLLTAFDQPASRPGQHAACSDPAIRAHLDDLVRAASVGGEGEAVLTGELSDKRFLEPYSGAYFQVSATGREPFASRSLWDRSLKIDGAGQAGTDRIYDSREFSPERLRVGERIVRLPSSSTLWRFQVGLAC